MNKMLMKASLAGGLILFVWGMVSWMILPWHTQTLNKFNNEERVYQTLRDNAPTSGVYILPNLYVHKAGMTQDQIDREDDRAAQMVDQGPVAFVAVTVGGVSRLPVSTFVVSFLTQVIGAFLVSWVFLHSKPMSYHRHMLFVTSIGFVVGLLGVLPFWTWWGFSLSFVLTVWVDLIIGWFLAGLAIVKICTPGTK